MMKFKTKVDLGITEDCSLLPPGTFRVCSHSVEVSWVLEPEFRSWGLKSLCYFAPDQTITVEIERQVGPEGREETFWETFDLDLRDVEIRTDTESHYLAPRALEYDEKQKKWILEF